MTDRNQTTPLVSPSNVIAKQEPVDLLVAEQELSDLDTRVLICGSRTVGPRGGRFIATVLTGLLEEAMQGFGNLVVIEGCAEGADWYAHHFFDGPCELPSGGSHAGHAHVVHEHYPADWEATCGPDCHTHRKRNARGLEYCPRQGYLRNVRMLEAHPDLVVAFTDKPLTRSAGTRMMVTLAESAGVRVMKVETPTG